MKVMVTGATTPLGAAIVGALLTRADIEHVLAVGRESDAGLPRHPKLERRAVDLTHARVVHDLVWGHARHAEIDVIVHGMQHRCSLDSGPRVHAQNVDATRELLLACLEHPTIRRLVYRSFGEVYAVSHTTPNLLDEEAALDLAPTSPQWIRDRVEADLTVCAHFGRSLQIAVLRCAEILAPDSGSQLWDYTQSRVCLRPLGFDPMINVLSLDDAAAAFVAAVTSSATGAFNITGYDTLPLSSAIAECRRADIPIPGPMMYPLYRLRSWLAGFEFRYDMNLRKFQFGGILDGTRARRELGFAPRTPVQWPRTRWQRLLQRLGEAQRAV